MDSKKRRREAIAKARARVVVTIYPLWQLPGDLYTNIVKRVRFLLRSALPRFLHPLGYRTHERDVYFYKSRSSIFDETGTYVRGPISKRYADATGRVLPGQRPAYIDMRTGVRASRLPQYYGPGY